MEDFTYKDTGNGRELHCEDAPLRELAASYGTPLFVYSTAAIKRQYSNYSQALAGFNKSAPGQAKIFYALKANSNLSILRLYKQLGAGFDTVSIGEMRRALLAGASGADIVFSGVGKSEEELRFAIEQEVASICIESESEFERLRALTTAMDKIAKLAVRINPEIDADTHPNIRTGGRQHKFGVARQTARKIIMQAQADARLKLVGISCHIGSQILSLEPFMAAAHRMRDFYDELLAAGVQLRQVGLGGGFGVAYRHEGEQALEPRNYEQLLQLFIDTPVNIVLEPGRSLISAAGCLLTKVEHIKHGDGEAKNFVIADAAMNDLLRPAMYDAYHEVYPVREAEDAESKIYDLVGPVCESGDVLARARQLAVKQDDLLILSDAGAYAMAMSSNYNSRCRAAEVMVDGGAARPIRRREELEDLWRLEEGLDD